MRRRDRGTWLAGGLAVGWLLSGGSALAGADGAALKRATDLPGQAESLRRDGVPPDEVEEALDAADDAGLSAGDTSELLDEADDAVKSNGNIDNFGGFVKSKLDEGLRGRDLAAAIHAEHKARGKGKPDHAGKGGKGGDKGKGAENGKGADKGKSGDRGNSGDRGKSGGGQGSGGQGSGGPGKANKGGKGAP